MILSRKFISDYIDLDKNLTIKQIAEDMTRVGNEYDIATPLINATNLVIGKIIACENHPDSDHLKICKVDIGSEILDIVCGAKNARVGIKVIVAKVGATLPDITIKQGTIRGQVSKGMLCSIKELGLDNKFLIPEDIEGIKELGEDAQIGADPIKYLGYDDEIIDFELTPNRGDELSMIGLAYELGAIYSKPVKDIDLSYNETSNSIKNEFEVNIKTNNCSLFLSKKVTDIQIKESPDFIKNRLIACGIRPINNVVDISNYVMLETGQPLHFYDANNLGDKLIVRMANNGEKLTTLDNIERELTTNDIVIANDKKAVGLAGVMGGLDTEVEPTTKSIIIESAIFDSVLVRKTSKKILRSEASNRFEKGLDPNRSYMAINRACHLLEKYANAKILKDMITIDNTNKEDKTITIQKDDINNVLGTNITTKEIEQIFQRLAFQTNTEEDTITVTVPTRRLDINIKEDLIEEVGRIYGINNIKGKLPVLTIKKGHYDKTTRGIKNKLVDLGLNEVLTQIFLNETEAITYLEDDCEAVKLLSPLSIEKNTLRPSLIPSLLKVYNYNKSHNQKDISIFEIGSAFYKKDDKLHETNKLCLLMTGNYFQQLGNNVKIDFYVIKGMMEEILEYLGYHNRYSIDTKELKDYFNKYQTARINLNGKTIGFIGKIHPTITKDDVFVLEIDLTKLLDNKISKLKYKEPNKYPSINKDVAFIVDKNIESEEIAKTIKKAAGKLLTEIKVFDVYIGDKIESGKKSIAYSLVFEDEKKTLTDEEVTKIFNQIITSVETKHHAILRDK